MKSNAVLTLFLSASALVSCGPGVPTVDFASRTGTEVLSVTDANTHAITPVSSGNSAGFNPPHGQPGHRCDIKVGQPLDSKPATKPKQFFNPLTAAPSLSTKNYSAPYVDPNVRTVSNASTGNLNPPHGQPGHRCDIKVGAPLPTGSSQAITSPTTTLSTPVNALNVSNTATGLNPKHGQPGHRCDIKVGEPLNSKPTVSNWTTPAAAPAVAATTPKPVAPGMNPAHGQPGHRCDIKVGEPLNSKPTATNWPTPGLTPWKPPVVK